MAFTAIDSATMINRFGSQDFQALLDCALVSTEAIDPSRYKDIYENPVKFDEAYNHPDPFQHKKWREAINLEFKKMEENQVWKKIK